MTESVYSTKVGDITTNETEATISNDNLEKKAKKAKRTRTEFNIEQFGIDNPGCVDANGKLLVVPATFNYKTYKELKQGSFANSSIYLMFKAEIMKQKAAIFTEMSVKLIERAEHVAKYGDDTQAKKVQKALAIKKRLADMRAAMLADGMSEEELESLFTL